MGFVAQRWNTSLLAVGVLLTAACGQTDGHSSQLPREQSPDPAHSSNPKVDPTPSGGSSTVPVEQPIEPQMPRQPPQGGLDPSTFPACGSEQARKLTDDIDGNCSFAMDAERIYYSSSRGILAIAKSGGTPERIGGANAPIQISLDSTTVYWSGTTFSSAPKGGGDQSLLRYATTAGIAATGDGVYFATWDLPTVVERLSPEGTIEPLVDMGEQAFLPHLFVDDSYVYLVEMSTAGQRPILRASLVDGKTEQLGSADLVRGLSVDSGFLYFTEESTQSLKRVPLAGGETETIASFAVFPVAVAASGDQVYVTLETLNYETHRYSGQVVRLATDGSKPCRVAEGADYGPDLAVDDQNVYWIFEHSLQSVAR